MADNITLTHIFDGSLTIEPEVTTFHNVRDVARELRSIVDHQTSIMESNVIVTKERVFWDTNVAVWQITFIVPDGPTQYDFVVANFLPAV